jgi:hypothetical protein
MSEEATMIAIPADLLDRLERLADANGCSIRDLILDALTTLASSSPAAPVADEYSDAERDEVAARLASLGYLDE